MSVGSRYLPRTAHSRSRITVYENHRIGVNVDFRQHRKREPLRQEAGVTKRFSYTGDLRSCDELG